MCCIETVVLSVSVRCTVFGTVVLSVSVRCAVLRLLCCLSQLDVLY